MTDNWIDIVAKKIYLRRHDIELTRHKIAEMIFDAQKNEIINNTLAELASLEIDRLRAKANKPRKRR